MVGRTHPLTPSHPHHLTPPSSEAEKVAEVAEIQYNQRIMEKEKLKRMSQIENEAHLATVTAEADAEFYKARKQAEANQVCVGVWPARCVEEGGQPGVYVEEASCFNVSERPLT